MKKNSLVRVTFKTGVVVEGILDSFSEKELWLTANNSNIKLVIFKPEDNILMMKIVEPEKEETRQAFEEQQTNNEQFVFEEPEHEPEVHAQKMRSSIDVNKATENLKPKVSTFNQKMKSAFAKKVDEISSDRKEITKQIKKSIQQEISDSYSKEAYGASSIPIRAVQKTR